MVLEKINPQGTLTQDDVQAFLAQALAGGDFQGKKVIFVVPDATRSCPLDLLFRGIVDALRPQARSLAFLVALGTHPVPDEAHLLAPFGLTPDTYKENYKDITIVPHRWEDPETFKTIGAFTPDQISGLTDGRFAMEVNIAVNRMIFDYDLCVLLGPVFPHEVVGFSGGHKYIFPGIGGPEFINFFHWLGAVITNPRINGTRETPVRTLVEKAAEFLTIPRKALCLVTREDAVHGLFFGPVRQTWEKATALSGQVHIQTVPKPFRQILSCSPPMYDDLWTGAKCMYKLEGIVADGGELIIYAPHITEVSYSHGKVLDQIGYHVRDYFLKQWDRFKGFPWGVVAHSTHLRGVGAFENGVEKPRIQVTLATGIPEARCHQIALGYRDPATIRIDDFQGREDEGILCVPHAGETLFRLDKLPEWAAINSNKNG